MIQNYGLTKESLTQSYKIITDETERENYLSFLKYYYFLSEPISLQQLKKNYYNNIPFLSIHNKNKRTSSNM